MKRVILLVIDGLGIGEMSNPATKIGKQANTLKSILSEHSNKQETLVQILNLEYRTNIMYFVGRSKLEYAGADSILGHKEIIGLKPNNKRTYIEDYKNILAEHLSKKYHIEKYDACICLNNSIIISNNIEGNSGVAINVLGDLNMHQFEELMHIGQAISNLTKALRVIIMGSKSINWNSIKSATKQRIDRYNNKNIKGIIISQTEAYKNNYRVQNIINPLSNKNNIIDSFLKNNNTVTLIGKTADFFGNQSTKNFYETNTIKIFQKLLNTIKTQKEGLIFANVQEIDLSGHAQDIKRSRRILCIVNEYLPVLIHSLKSEDLLIITADHGNDPLIGHPYHTREYVPLFVFNQNINRQKIKTCDSLSDIGASISEFYNLDLPENGTSFMQKQITSRLSKVC